MSGWSARPCGVSGRPPSKQRATSSRQRRTSSPAPLPWRLIDGIVDRPAEIPDGDDGAAVCRPAGRGRSSRSWCLSPMFARCKSGPPAGRCAGTARAPCRRAQEYRGGVEGGEDRAAGEHVESAALQLVQNPHPAKPGRAELEFQAAADAVAHRPAGGKERARPAQSRPRARPAMPASSIAPGDPLPARQPPAEGRPARKCGRAHGQRATSCQKFVS